MILEESIVWLGSLSSVHNNLSRIDNLFPEVFRENGLQGIPAHFCDDCVALWGLRSQNISRYSKMNYKTLDPASNNGLNIVGSITIAINRLYTTYS